MTATSHELQQVSCSRCGDLQRRRTISHHEICVRGTWSFPLSADLMPGRRSTYARMTELCQELHSKASKAFAHDNAQRTACTHTKKTNADRRIVRGARKLGRGVSRLLHRFHIPQRVQYILGTPLFAVHYNPPDYLLACCT